MCRIVSHQMLAGAPEYASLWRFTVGVLALLWRDAYLRGTFRYSLQGLALMPVFYFAIKCAKHFPFTLLNQPCVARIGVYPYAIYLIHHIVINVIEKNAPWLAARKPLLLPVTFVIATLYAAILDIYVDAYFRRLRKKTSLRSALHCRSQKMQYKPAIDGLRALAVVSVLLFHANASLLPGGYIGVDVFFVVSGHLITSLIYQELSVGRWFETGQAFREGRLWLIRVRV
jgi:peptidoglycan/LPS O-acetylase OafA/YrhL